MDRLSRHYPVGAELVPEGGAHFRVWAPRHERITLIDANSHKECVPVGKLQAEPNGYHSLYYAQAKPGDLYGFYLDDSQYLYPDPASRYQPQGPHGPSCLINPCQFKWEDHHWNGLKLKGQIIYELHIGTFTHQGSWMAAIEELSELAHLGITCLEIMPVAEFSGRFGWGYDGVSLFAPYHHYGHPDDFKKFINAAHALGMGVILDVVYNHIGPDGNYLGQYANDYFTDRYQNEWGDAINFDGPKSKPVREFFITNAVYWIEEYHLDGLRLDATQQIYDQSETHILSEIESATRKAAQNRSILLIAENESQHSRLVRKPNDGGYALDAIWNDDFHHSALVALTGRRDAYYIDHLGTPQEFVSAIKWGFLFQGQWYQWLQKHHGTPALDLPPEVFVQCIDNHDQIANSATGQRARLLSSPGVYRAMTALLLLAPQTPLLFQGQEFGSTSPFLYFADHHPELAALVKKGRFNYLAHFHHLPMEQIQNHLPSPEDSLSFELSKLNFEERKINSSIYQLHQDLINLRKQDPVFKIQSSKREGAILGLQSFLIRLFGENGNERLLVINLGVDQLLEHTPEPLLAPPAGKLWEFLWMSEDPDYGGAGIPEVETKKGWLIPGQSAVILKTCN